MRHKHADLIHAWAEGAVIQRKNTLGEWVEDGPLTTFANSCEYRIKPEPEPKPDIVCFYSAKVDEGHREFELHRLPYGVAKDNLKLIFDGETGKLKLAEVI